MSFKEFILRLLRVPERRVEVRLIVRDQSLMTLDEWRSTPDLVKLASGFINDVKFRSMLDVLRGASFANFQLSLMGVSTKDRAFMQARIEGYTYCLSNLESMGRYQKPTDALEETFEAPETPEPKQTQK